MRPKTTNNTLFITPRTYSADTRGIGKRIRAKNLKPVKVSQFHFDKVLNKLKNNNKGKAKKQQHPLVEEYGFAGNTSLTLCLQSSLNEIIHDTSPKPNYCYTGTYLLSEIHKTVLDHNWLHCLDLLKELLSYSGLTSRYLMYVFRLIFILLFNLKVPPNEMDMFLSVTLGIKDQKLKSDFLKTLFELPKDLKLGCRLEARKLREAQKRGSNETSECVVTPRILRSGPVRGRNKEKEQDVPSSSVDDSTVLESSTKRESTSQLENSNSAVEDVTPTSRASHRRKERNEDSPTSSVGDITVAEIWVKEEDSIGSA